MKPNVKALGRLALAGIIASLSAGCQSGAKDETQDESRKILNEEELRGLLDPASRELFDAMDENGRKLALDLANSACKGQNQCAGLNSCKNDRNACAGQGSCKGQSNCKFTDANLAIKVAAKHMMQERKNHMNAPSSQLESSSRTRTTTTSWSRSWEDR